MSYSCCAGKHINHEFHCIMCCQAEEEELEKLEKSAVRHEELLDEIVFLNWFLHLNKIYVDMGCVLHHWILKIGI